MKTAQEVIEKLGLVPLPEEGGFYKETFRSQRFVHSDSLGQMSEATCIYYLVTDESFSALHLVDMDEIFHFYCGSPVEMFQIDKDGQGKLVTLGSDIFSDQHPQWIVPHGVWQGTKIKNPTPGSWALLGCTVAPGFELKNFHIKNKTDLTAMFPEHAELIAEYARDF